MRWTRNCADRAWLRADEFANGDVSDISESPTRAATFSIDNATDAGPARFRAFSAGVIAGDTGVLMNNRMAYWHFSPGHANRLPPGKPVRHTMNAAMVFRDSRL